MRLIVSGALLTVLGAVPRTRREAHMKSGRAEADARARTRDKIAQLEDNTTQLKDYSWLSQVAPCTLKP